MTVDDGLEKLLAELQKKVEFEEEKIFSKKVIQEYRNPTNFGVLTKPDRSGTLKGLCGDTMRIDLVIKNDVIIIARFWTDGCGPSIACGNMLIKMIIGKHIREVLEIKSSQLLDALDGLPDDHQHCATLAINTLHKTFRLSY
jgi:nitrogen fixation NifU-like protein